MVDRLKKICFALRGVFMSNKVYSSQFKQEVVTAYKNEDFSVKELTERFQIPKVTLYKWDRDI